MTTSQLNESQKAAVMYNEGPSLIIAGAGSGKTRVLTYKIAYLLEVVGLQPYQIMALTFTNKAAREMKERIAQMVGEEKARYLSMGTFHSQFSKILRNEASLLGLSSNFTVYDTADSKNLIKAIVKEMQLDEKTYKPSVVLSRISAAKNKMVMPEQYNDATGASLDFMRRIPKVKEIYVAYQQRLKLAQAIDFDDMLCLTNLLFAKHPEVLEKYQNRYQFILVDEYQDTNYAQYLILKALAAKHRRICVVGDDSQSIYAFRGADISNILYFQKEYAESKLFKLEQNYRSTQVLVQAANSLIAHNKGRIPKTVFSNNQKGECIKLLEANSDIEEANMVALRIAKLVRSAQVEYKEIAVLYRINAQSRVLEEALRNHAIPYVIYGGLSFYQRKEIKDVLAYMRLLVNLSDEEAFKRCINYPARGIGETTIAKVRDVARTQRVSLFEVASNPLAYNLPVNQGTARKLVDFTQNMQRFAAMVDQEDAYQLASDVVRFSGIQTMLKETQDVESETAWQNISELLNGIREYVDTRMETDGVSPSLGEYLQEVVLLTDADTTNTENDNRVTLMTVHAAKGLEFDAVFVVGLEEELFPNGKDAENGDAIEEERRLLYVAITRAKQWCYMLYAKSRFRNGQSNSTFPSRFISEIDATCIEGSVRSVPRYNFSKQSESFFSKPMYSSHRGMPGSIRGGLGNRVENTPKPMSYNQPSVPSSGGFAVQSSVKVGQHVVHEKFGKGEVTMVDDSPNGTRIKVQFEHAGERLLLLKFAKIRLID